MRGEKKRVICGSDFSVHSGEAATAAAALAEAFDETLILLHAISENEQKAAPSVLAHAEQSLENEAERLRKMGATVRVELQPGAPYEVLTQAARRSTTRMIVVSSVGKVAVSRFLVGSVAERTAESSPSPTLVVRDPAPFSAWSTKKRPLKIVCGYEFSTAGDQLLEWLADFQEMGPCEITVVHVAWVPEQRNRLGEGASSQDAMQSHLEKELKAKVESILGAQSQSKVILSWARPDAELLPLSEKADLMVVGTHQRKGLSLFWLGSCSRAILREAPCSVLVVPPEKQKASRPAKLPTVSQVLVPVDLATKNTRHIAQGLTLLHDQGALHLLHVIPPGTLGGNREKELEKIRRRLLALAPDPAPPGVSILPLVVEHGSPATAILQTAERLGADCICLTTFAKSPVVGKLFGSVTHAVLERSRRPVLVVPVV